jgi:hypothetical protein
MSPLAQEALRKIRILRKYPYPQSSLAEQRVLKNLNVTDFTHVVNALEEIERAQ